MNKTLTSLAFILVLQIFKMSGADQLISIIKSRNIGKLSELLEKMDLDEINWKGENGETALHFACRGFYNEAVDQLVSTNGIDVNVKNNRGRRTPLHEAIYHSNAHAISKILTNPQVDVNVQNAIGRTPLNIACYCCNPQIVSQLLGSPGFDVNVQDGLGHTPLHIVCHIHNRNKSELRQIVSELLASPGVDVNVRDRVGFTAIMVSARGCQEEALKLLLEDPRVDLDAKDEDGRGLDEQVGYDIERNKKASKRKRTCLEMINNERRKRENRKLDQEQPSQDGNIGQGIEKIEKLNKEMGDLQKKWKENLDSRKQKKSVLNERQSSEKKMLAKKYKEDEATLKKKHEEEETVLEMTFSREDEVEQSHFAILRERRDELANELQKLTIDPAQDYSGDHEKLEAAQRSLECPVCMELMRPPTRIWMCPLSHIICEPCKNGLDKKKENRGQCPTCVTEWVTMRAWVAENFARTIFNE